MSLSQFLGPYVELQARRVPFTRNVCESFTCPKPEQGFCSQCGRRADQRLIPGFYPSPNIPSNIYGEALSPMQDDQVLGEMVVFRMGPNHHRGCARRFNSETPLNIIITPAMIEDELRWFTSAFAPELDILRALNFPVFEIRWGLLTSRR